MGRTACTEPRCLYKGEPYLVPYIQCVLTLSDPILLALTKAKTITVFNTVQVPTH